MSCTAMPEFDVRAVWGFGESQGTCTDVRRACRNHLCETDGSESPGRIEEGAPDIWRALYFRSALQPRSGHQSRSVLHWAGLRCFRSGWGYWLLVEGFQCPQGPLVGLYMTLQIVSIWSLAARLRMNSMVSCWPLSRTLLAIADIHTAKWWL